MDGAERREERKEGRVIGEGSRSEMVRRERKGEDEEGAEGKESGRGAG